MAWLKRRLKGTGGKSVDQFGWEAEQRRGRALTGEEVDAGSGVVTRRSVCKVYKLFRRSQTTTERSVFLDSEAEVWRLWDQQRRDRTGAPVPPQTHESLTSARQHLQILGQVVGGGGAVAVA